MSKYPVEPGTIIRLDKTVKKLNRPAGKLTLDHTLVIWVLRRGRLLKNRPPKERNIHILLCHVPVAHNFREHLILRRTVVQYEYLAQLMKPGYAVVADGVGWNYTNASYKRFYQKVGLL